MLDLDDVPPSRKARWRAPSMEHLSVIILRDGADSFLLMSPRSSARSFLHAVELSVVNVSE